MNLRTLASRIGLAVLAQIAIAAIVVFASSGSPMEAQESVAAPDLSSQPADVTPVAPTNNGGSVIGTFSGDGPFTVVGQATIVRGDPGQQVLRFSEDFRTNRGRQLEVVLRSESGEVVNLGALQAVSGQQDYELPDFVNVDTFNEVQLWGFQEGVSFGRAVLSGA